jgi:hypothetical protein
MAQLVRLHEIGQASLPLGHGSVRWDTLPQEIRDAVLALWLELMTQHLTRMSEGSAKLLPGGAAPLPSGEAER